MQHACTPLQLPPFLTAHHYPRVPKYFGTVAIISFLISPMMICQEDSWRDSSRWRTCLEACEWMTSFLLSCGCSHTCPTLRDTSRQHHTHSLSNWLCTLDFYWAATDPSDVETKEQCSAFVQMQLPNSDCKSRAQGHFSLLLPELQQRMLSAKVVDLPWQSCCKSWNCQITSETTSPGSHHQIILFWQSPRMKTALKGLIFSIVTFCVSYKASPWPQKGARWKTITFISWFLAERTHSIVPT